MTASVIHAESLSKLYRRGLNADPGRIPELDGLRGIAIGMIVILHYFLQAVRTTPGSPLAYALMPGRLAWSGVDLFFVLSGFLIGGILLDARSSSNYFHVFYTRRFFRIVPAYVLYLSLAFLLGTLAHTGAVSRLSFFEPDTLPWAPHLLFLQNFWMAARNTLGQLSITWSLAIEEQFYLTLPLLIRLLSPQRLLVALLAGILLAPASRIAFHALWPEHYVSWFVLMPCRADSLLLGVLGAVALRNPDWRPRLERNRRWMLALVALLACGVLFMTARSFDPYGLGMLTIGFTWLALFYLAILLCVLLYRDTWISACLRSRALTWIGTIAYGLYLFHGILLTVFWGLVFGRRLEIRTIAEFLVILATLITTVLLCRLSWTFFEKPLLRFGHRTDYQSAPSTSPKLVHS